MKFSFGVISKRRLSLTLLSTGILIMLVAYTRKIPYYSIFESESIGVLRTYKAAPLDLFTDTCLTSLNFTSIGLENVASVRSCNDISVCLSESNRLFSIKYSGSFQCMTLTMNVILDSIRADDTSHHHISSDRHAGTLNRTVLLETTSSIRDGSFSDQLVHAANAVSLRLWWQTYDDQDWTIVQLPVDTFYFHRNLSEEVCTHRISSNRSQCLQDLNPNHVFHHSHSGPWKHHRLPHTAHLQIHILHNVIVAMDGKVISSNVEICSLSCADSSSHWANIEYDKVNKCDEVFTIADVWGNAYYHSMVEGMSRLANLIDFLKINSHIVIHTSKKLLQIVIDLQRMLGLRNPLVSGAISARTLYLAPGEGCGWVRPLSVLSLTLKYRNLINTYFSQDDLCKNLIILIKRSRLRWLEQHDSINFLLGEAAKRYNFDYVVFDDRHLPGVKETMRLFYRARLIVAPHGAGLSNIVFTAPGATVVEVMCHSPAQRNPCFYSLAQTLGHAYVNILAKPNTEDYMKSVHDCGPLTIDIEYLDDMINMALRSMVKDSCG